MRVRAAGCWALLSACSGSSSVVDPCQRGVIDADAVRGASASVFGPAEPLGLGFSATTNGWVVDVDGDDAREVVLAEGLAVVAAEYGGGAFGTPAALASGGQQSWAGLASGDVDGDGASDVAVIDFGGEVRVLRGGAPELPRVTSAVNQAVRLADLDGDGRDEVVTGGSELLEVYALRGERLERIFVVRTLIGVLALTTGDWDGDGDDDVAALGLSRGSAGAAVEVLPADGSLPWGFGPSVASSFEQLLGMSSLRTPDGDVLVVAYRVGAMTLLETWGHPPGRPGTIEVLHVTPIALENVVTMGAGDLDGDGYDELVFSAIATFVLAREASGDWSPVAVLPDSTVLPGVPPGDLDGDGRDDLLVVELDAAQGRAELVMHRSVGAWPTVTCTLGRGEVVPLPALAPSEVTVSPGDSVQAAIERLGPRGTVLIEPGTYPVNLLVMDRQLVLKSTAGPGGTILRSAGLGPLLQAQPSGGSLTDLTIEGLQLIGIGGEGLSTASPALSLTNADTTYLVLRDNVITEHSGGGVVIQPGFGRSGPRVRLERNELRRNGQQTGSAAVSIEGWADQVDPGSVELLGNVIAENGSGVRVRGVGEVRMINETITANRAALVIEAARLVVRNSIVWADGPGAPDLRAAEADVDFSVMPAVPGLRVGEHQLDVDPRFVDGPGGDFRLQPGSPAIDTGTTTDALSVDRDGAPRRRGAGVDRGADEQWGAAGARESAWGRRASPWRRAPA